MFWEGWAVVAIVSLVVFAFMLEDDGAVAGAFALEEVSRFVALEEDMAGSFLTRCFVEGGRLRRGGL